MIAPPLAGVCCTASNATTRELVVEERLRLVVARDREVALRLDHEEARRHADLEAPLLGVEPLLGELPRRRASFRSAAGSVRAASAASRTSPHGRQLQAAQACGGLIAARSSPGRSCASRGALPERIAEREPERPRRVVGREHLAEHARRTTVSCVPTIVPGKPPVRSSRVPPAPFVRYVACDAQVGQRPGSATARRSSRCSRFPCASAIEVGPLGERAA